MKHLVISIKTFSASHSRFTIFLIILLLSMLFIVASHTVFNDNVFEIDGDAWSYWRHGHYSFDLGTGNLGYFSFHNYPNYIRGYFLPFLFYISSLIGRLLTNDGMYGFFLLNSVAIAFLISFLIPSMLNVENTPPPRSFLKNLLSAVALSLLLFIFWRWIFFETLADLYAFFFALLSLWLLRKATNALWTEKIRWAVGIPLLFVTGLISYVTYNTRTIYLFCAIAMLAFIAFGFFRREKSIKMRALITFLSLSVFMTGYIIAGIPEAIINYNHHNNFSIMVITYWGPYDNLFFWQLFQGIFVERYETYVGGIGSPETAVRFISPAGHLVLHHENITLDNINMRSYLRILANRPFDMLALYWRTFINALTPLYPIVYVRDLNSPVLHMITASTLLWFVGGLSLFQRLSLRTPFSLSKVLYKTNIPYWFCILLPCLFIIPSQMELRFMLPFHIFLYSVLCYKTDYRTLYSYIKRSPLLIICIFLIIYAFWVSTISTTLSTAQHGGFLIH